MRVQHLSAGKEGKRKKNFPLPRRKEAQAHITMLYRASPSPLPNDGGNSKNYCDGQREAVSFRRIRRRHTAEASAHE